MRSDKPAYDRAYHAGVRACITWLHARAQQMNDLHAKAVLNSAAFSLGADKPDPAQPPGAETE